jgi:AHBA synthesis associated protein
MDSPRGTCSRYNDTQVVIFDLDGVILDSWNLACDAFKYAYREAVGMGNPPVAEFRKLQGRGFRTILKMMNLPQVMYELFRTESRKRIHDTVLFPGVIECLLKLHTMNVKLGVATGKDGFRAREVLELHQILKYFNVVVGSDDVVNGKPDPESIDVILTTLRAPKCNTVFVGDSVNDAKAARAAGVTFIAALWGEQSPEELMAENPDHTADSITNTFQVISEIYGRQADFIDKWSQSREVR